jgi:DNA-directed RNA polymerase sigma subunit (sigma70/sigma32)
MADGSDSQEDQLFEKQEFEYRKKVLHDALNTLSKREYDIVCSYRLHSPTKSLRDIGESMNLSPERVRQIEKNAFLKIQKYVRTVEWEAAHRKDNRKSDRTAIKESSSWAWVVDLALALAALTFVVA